MLRRLVLGPFVCVAIAAAQILSTTASAARPRALALRQVNLELPGPPVAILPADLNGDGRQDLLIVVAYTSWGSIAQDRVENAVAVTEVVPALFDHREALPFFAEPDGTLKAAMPLTLPTSWISLARGSASYPVIALTEDGVSGLSWNSSAAGGAPSVTPLVSEASAFERGGAFLAGFAFTADVDGDGVLDAVIPARDGIAIHRGTQAGSFEPQASYRVRLPDDRVVAFAGGTRRRVPVPRFFDADGDGRTDLVVPDLDASPQRIVIARGLGEGRFAAPQSIRLGCLNAPPPVDAKAAESDDGPPRMSRRVAWIGDLDSDGRPDLVTRESVDTGKSDRKQATEPSMIYRFHHLRPDLTVVTEPFGSLEAKGYAFTGAFRDGVDLDFLDLDGDGRKDLVTVTIDFSMFQVLRALTSKKIGIGLDFRVFAQGADGVFRLVPDQILHEKLNVDLNRLEISRLGQFQGDFDGDGRIDFVHLGKGKEITIHRGQAGCRYPQKPDLSFELAEEPEDVMLVRVGDFDGDGRSDIAVTRTKAATEAGASAAVTLELRLSGEPR